jgi:hypothetical protein
VCIDLQNAGDDGACWGDAHLAVLQGLTLLPACFDVNHGHLGLIHAPCEPAGVGGGRVSGGSGVAAAQAGRASFPIHCGKHTQSQQNDTTALHSRRLLAMSTVVDLCALRPPLPVIGSHLVLLMQLPMQIAVLL